MKIYDQENRILSLKITNKIPLMKIIDKTVDEKKESFKDSIIYLTMKTCQKFNIGIERILKGEIDSFFIKCKKNESGCQKTIGFYKSEKHNTVELRVLLNDKPAYTFTFRKSDFTFCTGGKEVTELMHLDLLDLQDWIKYVIQERFNRYAGGQDETETQLSTTERKTFSNGKESREAKKLPVKEAVKEN